MAASPPRRFQLALELGDSLSCRSHSFRRDVSIVLRLSLHADLFCLHFLHLLRKTRNVFPIDSELVARLDRVANDEEGVDGGGELALRWAFNKIQQSRGRLYLGATGGRVRRPLC